MVILIASRGADPPDSLRPVAAPLWGRYDGSGTVVDINDGPNAERILAAFRRDLELGAAQADWGALGAEPVELDHIETLLALFRLNEIHAAGAVSWRGHTVSMALFESNVAAAWMQSEPSRLKDVAVDELARVVFFDHPLARGIYDDTRSEGPRLRCKFGLSFIALGALDDALAAAGLKWHGPGAGLDPAETEPALWLTEAYRLHAADEHMREALEEYTSTVLGGEDDEELGES